MTPTALGVSYQDVYLNTTDGVRLHAWWLPAARESRGTILFLHGNAENISTHFHSVAWLPAHGFNVLAFDYRGYGVSQGAPDLAGLHLDTEAALRYAWEHSAGTPLFVFGQSLGGSVALTALRESPLRPRVSALIVDSAFSDYPQIAAEKLKPLGFGLHHLSDLLIDGSYKPRQAAAELSPLPLLFLHGKADSIVPYHHAEQLYQAAREPKQLWLADNIGHIAILTDKTIRERLLNYLKGAYKLH